MLASRSALAADTRDRAEIKAAYEASAQQFADLEVEEAITTLESAIARAQTRGLGQDPVLAPLHAMRAGLIYSATGDRRKAMTDLRAAIDLDYYVQLPIELRSDELQQLLIKARKDADEPTDGPMVHQPPAADPLDELEFTVVVRAALPDGAKVVLYWRDQGSVEDYNRESMELFGNQASVTLEASEHQGGNLEYFFWAFDASDKPLANLGDEDQPLTIAMGGERPPLKGKQRPDDEDDRGKKAKKGPPQKWPGAEWGLPRVTIRLGLGTGFGIARGTAELTYQQFLPTIAPYGAQEQGCAIERWRAAGAPLAGSQTEFQRGTIEAIQGTSLGDRAFPPALQTVAAQYSAQFCRARHPVNTGLAIAPLHLQPEVEFRIHQRLTIGLFGRIQVVTATKIFEPDASKPLDQSFVEDVQTDAPVGVKVKVPFTWALGVKLRYYFLPNNFKLFAGVFAGYGNARLRVPLGFSQDRNGNSVPDQIEVGWARELQPDGTEVEGSCIEVWPWNQACNNDDPDTRDMQRGQADAIRMSSLNAEERVDVVRLGPGFIGGTFGFHYQIMKYFAVYAELDLGVYFPNATSALLDLTIGPAVTF